MIEQKTFLLKLYLIWLVAYSYPNADLVDNAGILLPGRLAPAN